MSAPGDGEPAVLLETRHVGVRIGSRVVLDDISLEAGAGRVLAVTGPAGSGKTTLLHLLAGIIRPTEGEVLVQGTTQPRFGWGVDKDLGFVPQIFGLAAALTAAENVALPLQLLRLPRAEVAERVQRTLVRLGLDNAADQLATELSGGQQQRTAVARAIVAEPRLIIADEPTSELDAANRDLVFGLLRAATERGATVVLATHDPDLVERCEDVVHLRDGRAVDGGNLSVLRLLCLVASTASAGAAGTTAAASGRLDAARSPAARDSISLVVPAEEQRGHRMIKEGPSATASGPAPSSERHRPGLGWVDVAVSAVLMLAVAGPTLAVEEDWHGHPMIDQPTHLWLVPVVLVMAAFVLGGALAGYRRPAAPALHATAAAGVAVAVLLLGAVARRVWLAHEGIPVDVAQLWCLAAVTAFVLSGVGSQLGRWLAVGAR